MSEQALKLVLETQGKDIDLLAQFHACRGLLVAVETSQDAKINVQTGDYRSAAQPGPQGLGVQLRSFRRHIIRINAGFLFGE